MSTIRVITWLHLSDYHLNGEKDVTKREMIKKDLLKDIGNRTKFSKNLEHIDFVLFTGDLAYHGWINEFNDAYQELLSPLMRILQIEANRVFIVPGNHEVHLNDATPPRKQWREKLLTSEIKLEDIEAIKKDITVMKSIFRPFANYNEFIGKYFPHISLENGYFRETLPLYGGMKVEIIGINTAWLANGEESENGKLSVGCPFIVELMKEENDVVLRLILMHHPIIWLNQFSDEYQLFKGEIIRRVDLLFHGHLHEENFQPHSEENRVFVPGGALFSGDVLERFWYSFGIYLVEEDRLEIHGREYRKEGKEEKFYSMPWSPYVHPLKRKGKPYDLGERIGVYSPPSSDLMQKELGEIVSKLKDFGITYAEIVKRTEERYSIFKGVPLFKITSQYTTLGAISLPSEETLTTISPENLFPHPERRLKT